MLFKRFVQTISYLPHFVSWVVVAGLVTKMLSIDGGIVNDILVALHIVDEPIQFMARELVLVHCNRFRHMERDRLEYDYLFSCNHRN